MLKNFKIYPINGKFLTSIDLIGPLQPLKQDLKKLQLKIKSKNWLGSSKINISDNKNNWFAEGFYHHSEIEGNFSFTCELRV